MSRVEKEAHVTVVDDQERVNGTPSSMTYPKIGRTEASELMRLFRASVKVV